MKRFPEGFLWGAATAAHQVEGGNENNDWWDWELVSGHIRNGDGSTVACDWWGGERYREDFDLAAAMHLNAQRLSIEWSRIEPREGKWSASTFACYRSILMALRERGMQPLVTLHHFTNPRWLVQKGGWENKAVVPLFERYATRVVQELGDLCSFWVTINEPNVYLYSGYINGNWPPGKKSLGLVLPVATNLVRGHAAAYRAIHRVQPNAQVGLGYNMLPLYPANPRSWLNRVIAGVQHRMYNQLFLRALQDGRLALAPMAGVDVPEAVGTQDYVGLNFYFSRQVAVDWRQIGMLFGRQLPPKPWGVTYEQDLDDWFGKGNLDPHALYETVMWLSQLGRPIYITEHGICDPTDELRPRFLVTCLGELHRAIEQGAPVKGYFHWSLMDNFEWKEGYALRFGLVQVDFKTQQRRPRPSAAIYGTIAEQNGIPDDLYERYGSLAPNLFARRAT